MQICLLRFLPNWTAEQASVCCGIQSDGTQGCDIAGVLDEAEPEAAALLRAEGQLRWSIESVLGWVQAPLSSRCDHWVYGHEAEAVLNLHKDDG